MRPPRVAILVLFFFASLFLFCRSITSGRQSPSATSGSSASSGPLAPTTPPANTGFRSLFSFSTPFTLFPPNAIISLTDDNSTSFQARPAAFGPPLPHRGLSGQLWIGSGFADDNLPDNEGEGELGCSDVPGWEDGTTGIAASISPAKKGYPKASKLLASPNAKSKNSKRGDGSKGPVVDRKAKLEEAGSTPPPSAKYRPFDDGTDDYLHQGLQRSSAGSRKETSPSGTTHADIQSIQEAAEITGKVALLSRGGCGFLEKVKWAQRRGAVAVIVGDNTKGGPLIQMFARGDTSNVTIPAIFTSRMTATILSSLVQPGSFIEDIIDENGNAIVKVQQSDKGRKHKKIRGQGGATASAAKTKAPAEPNTKGRSTRKSAPPGGEGPALASQPQSRGWLSNLFHWGGGTEGSSDKSWVLVDDWSDEKDSAIKKSMEKASKEGQPKASSHDDDDFVIGVQDWRDPDLVDTPSQRKGPSSDYGKEPGDQVKAAGAKANAAGASSGKSGGKKSAKPDGEDNGKGDGAASPKKQELGANSHGGLITKIFGDDDGADFSKSEPHVTGPATGADFSETREGLWVTITPTSSASPFFDTLLVLVVSPLITLSVVYALLILRARIRRRRWRAPKSVVERLPVRTYHTVASSTAQSSRIPSPTSSSPTTPLLQPQPQPQPNPPQQQPQQQQQASPSRPRPRSRTTTGVPDSGSGSLLRVDSDLQAPRPPSRAEHEEPASHRPSQWKKYMGRQVECVVCLEEYVDGVSRVMSLPCGHEFHVECITPWLTTRRRTCPICKGDVVRSLARGSPSSPRYEAYRDDSDDDDDDDDDDNGDEAGTSGSASGSNGATSPDRDEDLERGILASSGSQRPRRSNRTDGWLNLLSNSLGAVTSSARPSRDSEEDRRSR